MDEFKNWADFGDWCREQQLLLGGHELRMTWVHAYARVAEGGRPSTDRVVRSYIARREWPALEDSDRWELLLRLQCARWYCAELHEKFPDDLLADHYSDRAELLAGVLIDYWLDVGRCEWLQALGYWAIED
ncbi:MAG: hypothetical protein EA353_03730 [Puniceicoccaceae bacterium]|nr:MAG: hypothetical protein EA353_03730 [Puniceicoccaceae bacterium]